MIAHKNISDLLHQDYVEAPWEEPLPVEHSALPMVPILPEELIPEPLRAAVKDIAYRMQVSPEAIVCPMLVVVLSLIGSDCRVRPKLQDDWTITPNTWGALVDYPGKLKSGIIARATSDLLAPLVAAAKSSLKEAEKRFNTEEIAYQAEHSALRQKMKRAASQGASLDPLKTEFEKLEINKPPTEKRYETQSVTVEKLHELICENQHGLLVLVDELVRLFKTWEKPGHEADRAFFMEGWTGGQPFTSDTIGRGTLHTPCLTISLVGGIQPDKLQRFLLDAANGDDDGFPQRLQLAVFPDSKAWQYIDETPDVEAIRRIQQLVQSLDGLDYKKIGADFDTAGKYHFFRFSIEANDVFRRWITCLETEKIAKETNNLVRGHLAKYRSLMPSLALAFCLIRVSDLIAKGQDVSATITGDDAQNASNFCNYLESHARKIYALVDDAKQRATYALSRKITQGVLPNLFSLRDVYRNNWRNLGDKELVRAGCDGLIVMGWLREIEIPPGPEGGGPSTRFQINPKILFEEKKENG